MTPSEKRKKTRIELKIKAELHTLDGNIFTVNTENISFSGARIDSEDISDKYNNQTSLLKLLVSSEPDPLIIEFQAKVVHCKNGGTGVQFLGIDIERYRQFEALLFSHAEDRDLLLREMSSSEFLGATAMKNKFFQDELGNYIIDSVKDIFTAFLAIEKIIIGETVSTCGDDIKHEPSQEAEATAIINFNGAISGGIHLSAPTHIALHLASCLAGEKKFVCMQKGEAADAYGELANMIAGGVQTRLSGEYENINLTPPTVVVGNDYGMCYKSNLSCVKQYFKIDLGPFFVDCFFSA